MSFPLSTPWPQISPALSTASAPAAAERLSAAQRGGLLEALTAALAPVPGPDMESGPAAPAWGDLTPAARCPVPLPLAQPRQQEERNQGLPAAASLNGSKTLLTAPACLAKSR